MGRTVVVMGGATGTAADATCAREQRNRAWLYRQRRLSQTVPQHTLRNFRTQISGMWSKFTHIFIDTKSVKINAFQCLIACY